MLADSSSKKSNNLASAAELLIQAAQDHVEAQSLDQSKKTMEELEKLSSTSKDIEKGIKELKGSSDAKLTALTQAISELKVEMVKLNKATEMQTKLATLGWALKNVTLDSFRYYDNSNRKLLMGAELITSILLEFRSGHGHYIDGRMYKDANAQCYEYQSNTVTDAVKESYKKKFQDQLVKQISYLIGREPVVRKSDGRDAIYYE